MKELIKELKNKFPLISFSEVSYSWHNPCEDAFYPLGVEPKRKKIEGDFIRIENPMGGVDTVTVSNIDTIYSLAQWHQDRAVARGFIASL